MLELKVLAKESLHTFLDQGPFQFLQEFQVEAYLLLLVSLRFVCLCPYSNALA